jgi:methyltransferase (TIGR00027 family)
VQPAPFSRTALGAAGHRAAHQLFERGRIFDDPLAYRILGADTERALADAAADPRRRAFRLFIAVRSRFAEDCARCAISEGVRQIVLLGAGFDTFPYRLKAEAGLRVFEVDRPATQAEKRRRLAASDIAAPAHLTYVTCDFERAELGNALTSAGFDPGHRSFFLWLGVVPYLTEAAIFGTLGFIAKLPGGAEVAFDYPNPVETVADPEARVAFKALAEKVAALGEVLHTFFVTADLHEKLRLAGFTKIEDLGPAELAARYLPQEAPQRGANGGHVVLAGTLP